MKTHDGFQPFSHDAVAAARRAGRPLYLNVRARWCHWCHVMESTTLQDGGVRARLEREFVALRIDQDERPDLAERYADWGWPANIILSPDGDQLAEARGFLEVDELHALLDQANQPRRHRAGEAKAPRPGSLEVARSYVEDRLQSFYDDEAGGWGGFQKYPMAAPIEWSVRQADPPARARARQTGLGMLKLIDPVWGGAYQYSVHHGWDHPHYEKIASVQAMAIDAFSRLAMTEARPEFGAAADAVVRHALDFLRLDSGGFASSLDADVRHGSKVVVGEDYHKLSAERRRRIGLPERHDVLLADANGQLIHALCTHHRLLDRPASLAAAVDAACTVGETLVGPDGGFLHSRNHAGPLFLADQVWMGRALVALHDAAQGPLPEGLARLIMKDLQAEGGGFYAATSEANASGVFAARRRPLEDNGNTIRFLLEVADRTLDESLGEICRAAATRAASSFDLHAIDQEAQLVANFLLALDDVMRGPTKIVVDRKRTDLYDAARRNILGAPVVMSDTSAPEAAVLCIGAACTVCRTPTELALALSGQGPPRAA
jgi:uncharacterized protein